MDCPSCGRKNMIKASDSEFDSVKCEQVYYDMYHCPRCMELKFKITKVVPDTFRHFHITPKKIKVPIWSVS